jgi:hypothetical protein
VSTFKVSSIRCPECPGSEKVYLLIEDGLLRCRKCGWSISYPRELDPPLLRPEEKRE